MRPVQQQVALWAVLAALLSASVEGLAVCEPRGGQTVISSNCIWQQAGGAGAVQLQGPPAGVNSQPPILVLDPDGKQQTQLKTTAGFTLQLQRLVVKGARLAPSTGQGGVPVLLPLGLFSTAPTQLSMVDTRLLVAEQDFQAYLAFFSQQLDAEKLTAEGGSITMYTDNKSFLFIPAWSDGTTDLLSITIASGPCQQLGDLDIAGVLKLPQPGCNVMAANNTTLLATLLRNASIATPEPLLIRITSNVTIPPSLNASVLIRRPVVLLGLASSLTSIDFGMTVNVLNVTKPTGTLVFQGLVLENLAPGDSVSSLIAAPYSITTSTNMWPVYCNRSAALCVRMNNVTMVIPTEREVNYHIFMYTMYNSPAPSLHQLAAFMRTDLGFKQLEFMAGPGNDTMTIKKLRSRSWQFKNVITTTQGFVAPKLPAPPRPFVLSKGGPAPLVTAIRGCDTFDAALNYNSTRVFVWQLQRNVSLGSGGQRICNFPSGYVAASTYLFGQGLDTHGQQPEDGSPADGTVLQPAGAVAAAAVPPSDTVHSLSFGYVPNWFELPTDAQDKFMQVQNVTLAQLPQLPDSGAGSQGRSLRDLPGVSSPPGVWTVLLWPWQRSLSGSPLYVADSQLLLPEPEWSLLAQVARDDDSFAMQLQGSMGITFTGVALLQGGRAIRVGSLMGPGIRGTNLWLLKDPTPVSAIPGYTWPSNLAAAAAQSVSSGDAGQAATSGGLSTAAQAAVGVIVGVVGVLAVAAAVLLLRRRHRRRRTDQSTWLPKAHVPDVKGAALVRHASGHSDSARSAHGEQCDVASVADVSCHTPSHRSAACATASKAASSVAGTPGGPLTIDSRGSSTASSRAAAAYHRAPSTSVSAADSAEVNLTRSQKLGESSSSLLEQSIAKGLQRWSSAVSATTMHLMKQRLEVNNHSAMLLGGSSSPSSRIPAGQQALRSLQATPGSVQQSVGAGQHGSDAGPLQLHQIIGTGSFGSVHLGTWRGKQVAIKVMHLPADALADSPDQERAEQQSDSSSGPAGDTTSAAASECRRRQREQNSPPHMAIMEAVVSSTMSHPNVVQVFTYMLTPLMACELDQSKQQQQQQQHQDLCVSAVEVAAAGRGPCKPGPADASEAAAKGGVMSGWQLRLIMEYCDQGTLREALDCRRLPLMQDTSFPDPLVALALAHDVAAALLHLHSEGIVHGDLKAGNVLLTAASIASSAQQYHGSRKQGNSTALAWMQAGCLPLTAKVADFGLATPLGHADTHATMMTRGTPTHMSPELFMSGHVSKASDVYALGILLYELVTGLRAYAGVPVPLLPHEVAMGKLRPTWPDGLPSCCSVLRQLAESCWAQEPGDRPSIAEILGRLEGSCAGAAAAGADTTPAQAALVAKEAGAVKQPDRSSGQHLAQPPAAAQPPAGPQQPQGDQRQQRQHVLIKLPQDIQLSTRAQQQQQQQQQPLSSNAQPPCEQQQAQRQGQGQEGAGTAAEVAASPATTQSNRNALDWSEVSYGHNR